MKWGLSIVAVGAKKCCSKRHLRQLLTLFASLLLILCKDLVFAWKHCRLSCD